MAIYRFKYKCGKNFNHLLYINREDKYSKKGDLVHNASFNVPKEFESIEDFWESAVIHERINANIYREFEITLVREFNNELNKEILERFLDKTFKKDYVYNYSIHNPNQEQPHAHVMFCDRKLDGINRDKKLFFSRYNSKNPELGGTKKDRDIKKKNYVKEVRKSWEEHLNLYLAAHGIEKVSSDTLKKQRDKALEDGDFLKAHSLDREPLDRAKKRYTEEDLLEKLKFIKSNKIKKQLEKEYKEEKEKDKHKEYEKLLKKMYKKNFKEILEIKEKVETEIFKLDKKILDKNLENEALRMMSEGRYTKYRNNINSLFSKLKKSKMKEEKDGIKEKIKENKKALEDLKEELKDKLTDKCLKLKAKYMKEFIVKAEVLRAVDLVFENKLKKLTIKDEEEKLLYKAYIEKKDLKKEREKLRENVFKNNNKIKENLKNKSYTNLKNLKNENNILRKHERNIINSLKKIERSLKVKERISTREEFILDPFIPEYDFENEIER